MKEEIRALLASFDHSLYLGTAHPLETAREESQQFHIEKRDLYLRFRMAFQHGCLGIRYDTCRDTCHDVHSVQVMVDRAFYDLPNGAIEVRTMFTGLTVLYPHPLHFDIPIKDSGRSPAITKGTPILTSAHCTGVVAMRS